MKHWTTLSFLVGAMHLSACAMFGEYVWEFRSGEEAILYNHYEVGASPQTAAIVKEKWLSRESLSGRVVCLYKGTAETRVLEQCGDPSKKQAIQRKGYDTEWEYDWWTVYFRRGRVVYVQFKKETHEPEPIYRWNGKILRK